MSRKYAVESIVVVDRVAMAEGVGGQGGPCVLLGER